ncbi:hypothetical protein CU044_7328 [Streptomyces sp. L-9-10]|nr:hypothetical protein CU044_7328 [Streptomyces sp. L-9-10]
MRGGQLTDRVARQHVGAHTPRLQQTEQSDLDGEQRRLGHTRLVQRVGVLTEQHLTHPRIEPTQDLVQGLREHRETLGQFTPHAQPLGALTREQETHPAGLVHDPRDHGTCRLAVGHGRQSGQELGPVGGDQHRTVLQHRPRRHQRAARVRDGQLRSRVHKGGEPRGLLPQRLGAAGRQHPRHQVVAYRLRGFLPLHDGGLLDDGVRVRTTHTERRHTRPPRLAGLRPRLSLRQQRHRTGGPVHVRRRLGDVQRLRQHTIPHRHDHLDHTRHTGCRLRVTDVRLHRPQQQRPVGGPALAVGRQQRLRLDRVTQRRTRAVRLQGIHIGRRETRTGERLPDHPLLRGTVRRGQAVGRTVLVHRGPTYHRQHLVAVAPGVRQPLHDQHADTLTPAGAVGAVGERLAPAVRGQTPLAAELDERARRRHHCHTADQPEFTLALVQRLYRQVQCHQRRRARCVHRDGGPLKAERVRQPAGDDTRRDTRAGVSLDGLVRGHHQRAVVLAVGADEHTGPTAPYRMRVDARPLEGLPGGLQQQSLLGVHGQCLARRDPEERRVESRRLVKESAFTRVCGARVVGVGVVQGLHVPATVGRELRHRVPTRRDQSP